MACTWMWIGEDGTEGMQAHVFAAFCNAKVKLRARAMARKHKMTISSGLSERMIPLMTLQSSRPARDGMQIGTKYMNTCVLLRVCLHACVFAIASTTRTHATQT